jgi:bacterioferritin-associated ferredoxin
MYVCICKGITDHQIRNAVREGASSMRDLRVRLGACSECGKCGQCAQEILRQCLHEVRVVSKPSLDFVVASY